MPTDAKPCGPQFGRRHYRVLRQIVKNRTAVVIKLRDLRLSGVLHATDTPGIVKRKGSTRPLDAVINLGCRDHGSVSRQSHTPASPRSWKSGDSGLKSYSGNLLVVFGRGPC